MLRKCAFFLVISAATITTVRGLQCYSCDSRTQPNCAAPFNTNLIQPFNCGDVADTCVTYTAKTVANVVYTVRDCTTFFSGKPCDVFKNNVETRNETLQSCYSCQSDYCNKSNGLRSVLALVALALVVHYFCTKL